VVDLTGFNAGIISVPPSVTIPENSIGENVTVTPLWRRGHNDLGVERRFQSAIGTINVSTPAISVALNCAGGRCYANHQRNRYLEPACAARPRHNRDAFPGLGWPSILRTSLLPRVARRERSI
jgi:hypothetical protein